MHISVYLAYLQLDVLKVKAGIIEPLPEAVRNWNKAASTEQPAEATVKKPVFDPRTHRIIDNVPDGSGGGDSSDGGSGLTDGSGSGIIEHREEIISELRSNGFTYEVHIPARVIDVNSLSFDSAHITQRRHFVTQEQAKSYIKNAKMSYTKTVDGDVYENYISDDGAAYVNTGVGLIRTAFPSSQFNPGTIAILNILNKYEEEE